VVPGGVDRSGRERTIPALLWLIERLARRHDVTVIALGQEEERGEWNLLGARVVDLGRPRHFAIPGVGLMLRIGQLRGAINDAHFDVVHAFWASPSGFLATTAFPRRTPLVVSLAGGELAAIPQIGYGRGLIARERMKVSFALRHAAVVTAASGPMLRAAAKAGFAARLVPLGVETAGFLSPLPRGPAEGLRLLHIGSLNRVKDQATLLRAFAEARLRVPRMVLDIVGEDTLGGEVQRIAASLGLTGSVSFHGWLPTDQVRLFLRRTDLFVLSSLHEAGPVALMEAAACRVPTVGTAVGHVVDGSPQRCLAVPVGDSKNLAEAIVTLAVDSRRRNQMGEAAFAWAAQNDADATAARFEAIYGELAGISQS
jgi:glycosyltransferase involved in cell wall biosynthesis